MKTALAVLACLLVACQSSTDRAPLAPTAPARTLAISTDSVPAAPTNVAVTVDSASATIAYITATWTDNTAGRARYQLFEYYNGVPNAAGVTEGLTGGLESLSTRTALGQHDFYLRALIYINDVTGVTVYSEPVGPVTVFAGSTTVATAKKKRAK